MGFDFGHHIDVFSPVVSSGGSNSVSRKILRTSAACRLPRVTHSLVRSPICICTQRTVSSACQAVGEEIMTLTECSKRTARLAITEACQQGWIVAANGHYRSP